MKIALAIAMVLSIASLALVGAGIYSMFNYKEGGDDE